MSDQRPIYLCSFYSKKYQYQFAAKRLSKQIAKLNIFQQTFIYDENNFFDLLRISHNHLLQIFQKEKISPGFAYWAWKPIIISETLKIIPDQSILLYVDIGCDLIQNDLYWSKIREKIDSSQMITAYSFGHGFKKFGEMEYNWSKAEIFEEIHISNADRNSPQYQATWIMLVNNSRNREFIQEWQHYCTLDNLSLVKPVLNKNISHSKLIESKNDQAVFSCLIKKNSLSLSVATIEDMNIIRASRNLSMFEFSKSNLFNRIIKYLERRIIRVLNYINN